MRYCRIVKHKNEFVLDYYCMASGEKAAQMSAYTSLVKIVFISL
jgi:hypothetical protein